jgi:hypothetical protein
MDLGKIIGEFPTQLLYAAVIALIFSGTGRIWSQVTHRRAGAAAGMQMGQVMGGVPAPQPAPHPAAYPVTRRGVNYGRVLLHIGVFQLAVNMVGFVIGFLLGALLYAAGQSTTSEGANALFFLVILVFGTLALITGFLIIGLRVERSIRLRHMTYVALGLATTTIIINWLAGVLRPTSVGVVIGAVIFALIQTFFGMGVGGGLSFLIGGRQDPTPMSQPYPHGAPPSVPLYPGQPAAPSRPLYQPQPGPQPYRSQYPAQQPYPPQQGQQSAPYYPPPGPGAPQYPPQQGAPQYPPRPPAGPAQPYPPNAGQPPRYPPQYPPQQPPAGEQGGHNQ